MTPPPVAEYGTRVPSLLLTLAERERQEETARAPVDRRRELAPRRQSAAELAALAEKGGSRSLFDNLDRNGMPARDDAQAHPLIS
jgi:hypothetical protein